jgi:DNA-binding XRE family transcriptional regulator
MRERRYVLPDIESVREHIPTETRTCTCGATFEAELRPGRRKRYCSPGCYPSARRRDELHDDLVYADCTIEDEVRRLLVSIRCRAGLTRIQLAERLGVDDRAIRRIEAGSVKVRIEHLAMYARGCETSVGVQCYE